MSNSTSGANFWVPEYIIGDGTIRAIFKTYFLVMIICIAVLGNWCLRLAVKHKLLRSEPVSLSQTTGWVHGPALAILSFQMRKLPGGWLGWFMLLISALDIVGEYGVAVAVKSQTLATTEYYYQGGYVVPFNTTPIPSLNNGAFLYASQAQRNSFRNANATNLAEKHYGIYPLITNDTNFMAQPQDIIGYWSCSLRTPQPLVFDQKWKDPSKDEIYDLDVWSDLLRRDDVYDGWQYLISNVTRRDPDTDVPYGPSTHTSIFSASTYEIGSLFNVSAAIDILDLDDAGSKQMAVFLCQLRATDAAKTVETIAKTIDIRSTLFNWRTPLAAAMYPGLRDKNAHSVQDIEVTLQMYLNAMIMVSGSNEIVTTQSTAPTGLGVVYRATQVPYWVVILCVLLNLVMWFLVSAGSYLMVVSRAQSVLHDMNNKDGTVVSGLEIRNNTPIGLLDWMSHAAYESRDAEQLPRRRDLKSWILSTTWHAGRRLAIVRSSEQGLVNPARTPGVEAIYQQNTPSAQQSGYFPEQKANYTAVSTREFS